MAVKSMLLTSNWSNLQYICRKFGAFGRISCSRTSLRTPVIRSCSNVTPDKDDKEETSEIDSKRNVSNLSEYLRNRMKHVNKSPDVDKVFMSSRKKLQWKRLVYAKYGKKSGINSSLMWPSEEKLDEVLELEQSEPTLQEKWTIMNVKREQQAEIRLKKEAHVEKQMAKMPGYIQQYRQQLKKQEGDEKTMEEKQKALLIDAREYFGYSIDVRDPRFKQMLAEKDEEEKLLKKKKKKEEKQTKFLEALQHMQEKSKN